MSHPLFRRRESDRKGRSDVYGFLTKQPGPMTKQNEEPMTREQAGRFQERLRQLGYTTEIRRSGS